MIVDDMPVQVKHWYAVRDDRAYEFTSPVARSEFCEDFGAQPISAQTFRLLYHQRPKHDDMLDRIYHEPKGLVI